MLLACIWHRLHLLTTNPDSSLPSGAVVAGSCQGLSGEQCPVESRHWEVDCWSSWLWPSEQTSQPRNPKWMGRGWDLIVACGYKGLQGLAVQCHLAQGLGDTPAASLGLCWAVQSWPFPQLSSREPKMALLAPSSAFVCFVLPLRTTPGTAAAAFPMLLFNLVCNRTVESSYQCPGLCYT